MPFVTTMPKLSPTMEEGSIAKWLKKEGEFVEANEPLLEITTDKATVEHTALDEGWLRKILIPAGKSAVINAPLAIFSEKKDEDISLILKEMEKKAEEKPKVQMESISPSDVGMQPAKGALRSEPIFTPEPPLEHYDFSALLKERKERYPKSPLAKKIAKERNLDITSVKGSGPHGRVEAKDLEHAKPLGMVPWEELELPEALPGSYDEIELSPMRKAIGRRLQDAKSHIPHFYLMRKIDAGALFELRRQLEQLGLKITYNDLILRASALALRKHPALNTGFNSQNQTIIQFKTIDISVAVGFEGGLITPIIRHADYKGVHEISEEMSVLKERAKSNKLKEHEYKGGSFTISNLGMYGVSEFIAVINPPQSSILAIANIEDAALVRGGQIVAGKTLMLSLACDHRVIDGADAAQFLGTLKTLLENPAGLLI